MTVREEFFELVGDALEGYKGRFFFPYDMLENYQLLLPLRNNGFNETYRLLEIIKYYEDLNLKCEFALFLNKVHENVKKTNIDKYGYCKNEISQINSSYVWKKDPDFLFPYLFLDNPNFIEQKILFKNYNFVESELLNGHGAILTLFHWGVFQNFTPLFLIKKVKFNFLANYYACMYLKEMIDIYIPEYSQYIDYIVTGDPTILRKSLDKLKKNEIICVLPELSLGLAKPKYRMEFLGNTVYVPDGAAVLSYLSGAKIIPCKVIKEEVDNTFKYKLDFLQIINNNTDDKFTKEKYIGETCVKIFEILENEITKDPYHWCGWEIYDRMITGE